MGKVTYKIIHRNGQRGIKCLDCGLTSWNSNDVIYKYCGNCNQFHDLKQQSERARDEIINIFNTIEKDCKITIKNLSRIEKKLVK